MPGEDTLLGGKEPTDPTNKNANPSNPDGGDPKPPEGGDPKPPEGGGPKPPEGGDPKPPEGGDPKPPEPLTTESLTFTEGTEVNKAGLEKFVSVANEAKLTKEQAQAIVNLQLEMATKQAEAFAAERASWVKTIREDAELGGPGYDKNLELARRAMQNFATPALRELLNATGFGDHPEVFRLMLKVGKAIQEAKFIEGKTGGKTDPQRPEDIMFGQMFKKT